MRSILLLILLFLFPFSAFSADPKKHCEINVKYFYKTGATGIKKYKLVAKSKENCVQKSNLYRENSTPQNVKKKEVSVKWTGK